MEDFMVVQSPADGNITNGVLGLFRRDPFLGLSPGRSQEKHVVTTVVIKHQESYYSILTNKSNVYERIITMAFTILIFLSRNA